ncbi:MAG: SDR family NAD(P)-dependent oxidoreductase [Candidatus ainarchaeum sp.]|nr:SDR family NAD(P)-dependent oxidoreductase [Candidatus ainarchaeum sp.]
MEDFFKGKTILVTGGTGFLGTALVKRLLEYGPHAIRVLSNDEFGHYQSQKNFEDPRIRHLLGDVRDLERMRIACQDADVVIHAAALKRIDLIEYNVMEGVYTNVMGTMNVVRACLDQKVPKAVFISTDKACSPLNSYGATKMLGERIFVESNYNKGRSKTALVAVRYGNVLNSTGSAVPIFLERIAQGKDLCITDERMTRFAISEDRAVDEVMNAIKYGTGGEIFVPKLVSNRVTDLVEVLLEHFKAKNRTKVVGIRPGEKIHEELINESESTRAYEFRDSYVILSQIYSGKPEYYPYLKGKKTVNFTNFSSKDFVVSKKELKELLIKAKILN